MTEALYRPLGLAFRSVRESKDLTLRDVAEKAGVSPTTVSMFEKGERDAGINTVLALCRVLDKSPVEMFNIAAALNKEAKAIQIIETRDKAELKKLTEAIRAKVSELSPTLKSDQRRKERALHRV